VQNKRGGEVKNEISLKKIFLKYNYTLFGNIELLFCNLIFNESFAKSLEKM